MAKGHRKYSTGADRAMIWDRPMLEIRKDAPVNTTAHLG